VQGKPVVTSDDHKAGHVVDVQGEYLIVETGTLRKHKHVLPKAFATERGDEVCATVTWDILKDAPEVDGDGSIDRDAVAEHYGLAEQFAEPPTEGYGESLPDDPAYGPEQAARAGGVATAEEERLAVREKLSAGADERPDHPSPGITGGDRYRDAPGTKPPQGE
jgi:hypothetical protein